MSIFIQGKALSECTMQISPFKFEIWILEKLYFRRRFLHRLILSNKLKNISDSESRGIRTQNLPAWGVVCMCVCVVVYWCEGTIAGKRTEQLWQSYPLEWSERSVIYFNCFLTFGERLLQWLCLNSLASNYSITQANWHPVLSFIGWVIG